MRKIFLAIAAIMTCLASLAQAQTTAPSDRIRYDKQCFIIDGKDTFLYSGSLHYFRCPKPLWADRLQRMKDAGMNCVETYVAWNWHEQQPPANLNDFSHMNLTDLTDFLDLAINKFGLYVILRPGPYICAEWDGGGYPQWLLTKRPADVRGNWYRSDDPTYLQWCNHWMSAVARASAPFQITHQPAGKTGVILWQIENEYNYAQFPAPVKLHQLQALAHDSRDAGIDVPLITCMTSDPLFQTDPFLTSNVIECRNTYPKFSPGNELKDLLALDKYQPDKPRMITELQGGWFSEVGNKLSQDMGYTAAQITHVTLLAWAHGFTGTNYYMMYGGTNFGDWGSASKTTTYDYAAPIREWGGVGDRYFAVQGMGAFLKEDGALLARSVEEQIKVDPPVPGISVVSRIAPDGTRFIFVMNDSGTKTASGVLELTAPRKLEIPYDLDAYGARILYLGPGAISEAQGFWFPRPADPPKRPSEVPDPVNITEARRQIEPLPPENAWHDLADGASIEDAGIFDRRYVFYRTQLSALAPVQSATTQPAGPSLITYLPRQDSLIAQLDGARQTLRRAGRNGAINADLSAATGTLLMLYENGGRDNGGAIDAVGGPRALALKSADATLPAHWQIAADTPGQLGKWQSPNLDDHAWPTIHLDQQPSTQPSDVPINLVWYRMSFSLPTQDPHVWVPWKLHLQATGNGLIYLNGQPLGRWWEAGPQTDFYLPECWLNFGAGSKNNLTLCLRPTTAVAAVKSAVVSPYADFAEAR